LNILIFDTATPLEFIILGGESDVFMHHETVDRTHSATIFQNMKKLLNEARIDLSSIDLIAAGIGPGSFTGIRIAVTTARMLAQILNIPLIGIKTHELYASSVQASPGEQILIAFDARKKRVFGALYRHGEQPGETVELVPPGDYGMEELLQKADPEARTWCAGDGIGPYGTIVDEILKNHRHLENFIPSGDAILELVLKKYKTGKNKIHYSEIHPFYARKSDAETARGK